MTRNCKARQYSDQMLCDACGLAWDVNDPEPPRCLSEKQQRAKRSAKWIARLREKLKT